MDSEYKKKYHKYKAKYLKLKIQVGGKPKVLATIDWLTWIEENNLALKIDDLKKLKPGDKIELYASLSQYTWNPDFTGIAVKPKIFFEDAKSVFEYPHILDGVSYERQATDDKITEHAPFYDCGDGIAGLGSGCDISIMASKIDKAPDIITYDGELDDDDYAYK